MPLVSTLISFGRIKTELCGIERPIEFDVVHHQRNGLSVLIMPRVFNTNWKLGLGIDKYPPYQRLFLHRKYLDLYAKDSRLSSASFFVGQSADGLFTNILDLLIDVKTVG